MRKMPLRLAASALAMLFLSACEQSLRAARSDTPPDRYADPQKIARGKAVYEENCMTCHGIDGKGPPGDWRIRDADGRFPPPPLDDSAHA